MFWTIWLLMWIFIGGLPMATTLGWIVQKMFKRRRDFSDYEEIKSEDFIVMGLLRGIFSLLFGLLCLGIMLVDTTMWWVFLFWLTIWTIIEAFVVKAHAGIKTISIAAFIILLISGAWIGFHANFNNALHFDQFIQKGEGFPIVNEVPDHLLRLTTEDLAISIIKQHMSEFGSNVAIADMQVTMYKDRLSWIALIAQQKAWGCYFGIEGMVVVDANDPNRQPEIIKDEQFAVADGLTFNPIFGANGNAKARGYFGIDTALSYGDVYPVITPEGKWAIAITTYQLEFSGVQGYTGVYLLDKRGNVIEFYDRNIPSWLIQPFDEDGFLEGGIAAWGGSRTDNGFSPTAGGFLWIGASNNRVKMTEDTRYVFDPDTNQVVAMGMTSPIRDKGEFSLAGAFKTTSQGITYYDLSQYNLLSGDAAGAVLMSKADVKAQTEYYTEMELLYPLPVGNETMQVWFVPIYFKNTQNNLIGLAGLGLVDAQDQDNWVIEYTEQGFSGSALIRKAKEAFQRLISTPSEPITPEFRIVNGTLAAKQELYARNGTSHQWLTIATSEGNVDVLIKANLLTDLEMLRLQKLQIGDYLSLKIDRDKTVREVLN